MSYEFIGFVAATLTTAAFLPQVYRTWKTRSAHDFSALWFLMFGGGLACWLAYGIVRDDTALIAANCLTLVLVLSIAWVKWRNP